MVILLFLVTFFVVLKIVREYYASNWNKGLSASVRFGAECINEGETGHICEEIINDKFLPSAEVRHHSRTDRSYACNHHAAGSEEGRPGSHSG